MPTMTTTVSRGQIIDCLYEADVEAEEALRSDYIGRGMYGGATCFGIIGSLPQLLRFFVQIGQQDPLLGDELAQHVSSDNMGYDSIFYFPGYQVSE